jgi:hypothetical protein
VAATASGRPPAPSGDENRSPANQAGVEVVDRLLEVVE